MNNVYWLEQTSADVPQGNGWLGPFELTCMEQLRIEKRRADWRLGRWTAKRAVACCLQIPRYSDAPGEIEIRPAPSGAPEVFVGSAPAPVVISLSHREGMAMCAVAARGTMLGCDLEAIEPRIDAFVSDYFTAEEQSAVRQAPTADRFALIALLWSAKESALKALREGLRLSTLALNVHVTGQQYLHTAEWFPLQVEYSKRVLHGWWQRHGDFVRTVVAQPLAAPPVALHLPGQAIDDSPATGLRRQTRYPFLRACG